MGWNDKRSVKVGAYDADEHLIPIGNVTVPEKYQDQVSEGIVLRVRYLYATSAGILYQPCLDPDASGCVVRDDLDQKDCLTSQLKYEGKD